MKKHFFVDITELTDCPQNMSHDDATYELFDNVPFRSEVDDAKIDSSIAIDDRYFRCHSQAPRDFYILKYERFKRIPDIVIWPKCHEEVDVVVKLANKHNVVLIPAGGLTNVTCANNCPEEETRTIVSLDLTQMNRMLWIDNHSLMACFEAGVAGQDLESTLHERGLTMGHEPDSVEFSTLGGWIATRSSGIKQQAYGNIEDIVISTRTVTSIGVLDKNFIAPRVSMGPELEHIIMGSEGTLGVITEVVVKIHKIPAVQRYGSIFFHDLQSGIRCFEECARKNVLPSSLRLLDSTHIHFGLALRFNASFFGELIDNVKKAALTSVLGFDENSFAIATFLIEGEKQYVNQLESQLIAISKRFGGFNTGEKYGKRGYLMTFTVGYSRVRVEKLRFVHES